MKTVHLICAARPNFMKVAPLYHELRKKTAYKTEIIHTGQHYDYQMSQTFFNDLHLPSPDHYLGIGSGTHAEQTAQTMIAYEQTCLQKTKPDLVIVVGDVNATLACSITAKKLHYLLAHLEAGLRSGDPTMPEEINRLATDCITDYHWTPSQDATDHLIKEGVQPHQISFVGNIMIDTYIMFKKAIDERQFFQHFNVTPKNYVVLTLHRPLNVDCLENLEKIMEKLSEIELPIIFSVHPRTIKNLKNIKLLPKNLHQMGPLGYVDFMSLVSNSAYVISDSGGIQEETTYLNIPCFTLRSTTERPITVTLGSNQLITINTLLEKIKQPKSGVIPPLWDGKTAQRIIPVIAKIIS